MALLGWLADFSKQPGTPGKPVSSQGPQANYTSSMAATPPPAVSTPRSGPINPVPPVDQLAASRLHSFLFQVVEAEKNTLPQGELCEQLKAALDTLKSGDAKYADGAQQGAIARSTKCAEQIRESDQRWEAVVASGEVARKSLTLSDTRRFVGTTKSLEQFDQSRSLSVRQRWLELAAESQKELDAFERDLGEIVSLAAIYLPNDPANLKVAEDLAITYRRIESLKLRLAAEELEGNQQSGVNVAKQAIRLLKASDERLQSLIQAWDRKADAPTALTQAISALSDLDRIRWEAKSNRPATLAEIEVQAGNGVGKALSDALDSYHRQKSRALANRVIDLHSLAGRLKAPLTEEMIARAESVALELTESRARLKELEGAVQAWDAYREKGGPRDLRIEERILKAYGAISAQAGRPDDGFDLEGISDQERETVDRAALAVAAVSGRVATESRQNIPLVLDISALSDDRVVAPVAELITSKLKKNGFKVVDQPQGALWQLVVTDPYLSSREIDNATGYPTHKMTLSASLTWLYTKKQLQLGTINAQGLARDPSLALKDTYEKMATSLLEKVRSVLANNH